MVDFIINENMNAINNSSITKLTELVSISDEYTIRFIKTILLSLLGLVLGAILGYITNNGFVDVFSVVGLVIGASFGKKEVTFIIKFDSGKYALCSTNRKIYSELQSKVNK